MKIKSLVIRRFRAPTCTTTIEVQQWLPGPVFLIVLVWYLAAPTKVAAMAATTLLGILLIAFIWARLMAVKVNGSRRLRYAALQVGDELEEEVTLENDSILPVLWAEFVDRSNIPGYTVTSVRASDPDSEIRWRARAICSRRGVFTLGPWELLLGDPFGIFRVRKVYHQEQDLLVYPPLANLPPHLLKHSGVQGDQRPLRQPLRAETINAFGSRPYVEGDPLRHIHWRTTARKNNPYVKLFEPEAATSIWLIPDCDAGVHLAAPDESTFETMLLILSTLASEMLHDQLSVGLYANAQEETIVLPKRGQPHLWEILRALAPLEITDQPLAGTLDRVRTLMSARSMILIVTPSLSTDWLPFARRLSGARGGGRAECILLDPASFGGKGNAHNFVPLLAESSVIAQVIERGQVKPISASYGELSRWEFKQLATGRALARHTPREAASANLNQTVKSWSEPS